MLLWWPPWVRAQSAKFIDSILSPLWWPSHTHPECGCCCIATAVCGCVLSPVLPFSSSTILRPTLAWWCIHSPTYYVTIKTNCSEAIGCYDGNRSNRISNSAWCSPLVLVVKKYGSTQFCVGGFDQHAECHVSSPRKELPCRTLSACWLWRYHP